MNPALLSIPLAYLLGSIPFGYLLVRFVRKTDIRSFGSGNIGATNVARGGGKWLGVATLLLDAIKGAVAVGCAFLLARHGGAELLPGGVYDLEILAGVAAVVGHCFPIWLGFRGGKGVACALGVFLALAPSATVGAIAVFLLLLFTFRFVSLASIAAAAAFPAIALVLLPSPSQTAIAGFLFIPALIIAKHSGNIRRLLAGTESRFGRRAADLDTQGSDTHGAAA